MKGSRKGNSCGMSTGYEGLHVKVINDGYEPTGSSLGRDHIQWQ